ncbi:MAG: SRPBCC domain-containing protein [Chloroflexota bacterium]
MSRSQTETLRMERLFDAPPERLFAYFTDPELMKSWWSPGGTTMLEGEIDLRVNGRCRWKMQTPNGQIAYLNGVIQAVEPPSCLVLTHHWEGAASETLVTLEFIPQAAGKTKLLLTQEGISDRTMLAALRKGWALPFEQLASGMERIK